MGAQLEQDLHRLLPHRRTLHRQIFQDLHPHSTFCPIRFHTERLDHLENFGWDLGQVEHELDQARAG